jgi:hypothetical protein
MILHLSMAGRISDILVEAFVNATEDEPRVREAIRNVLGEDVDLQVQTVEGSFGNPVTILRARIERRKEVERAMDHMSGTEFFARSLERAEERLDEGGVYHLRIDKASAYLGHPGLWQGGESVEVRIKVTTYPFSYPEALSFIQGLGPQVEQR